jgi:L-fucose isomerase-like protein
MSQFTLAVIIGNRDFFPDVLISEAREDLTKLFHEFDIQPIWLGVDETKRGSVETWNHANQCADLFRQKKSEIDGVLVCLPNFGDEKGVADTLKLAGLEVPILVQAYPDALDGLHVERRRDAFCGKISVCNNLRQYGLPFSLTREHTVHPLSDSFKDDLRKFVSICRTVNGLKKARLGAIGARPNAFNTVRYSEKLFQAAGITVNTIDLSEILGTVQKLNNEDPRVKEKLDEINAYADAGKVPQASMSAMAKLLVVTTDWMEALDLDATAFQCWTSLQQNFGVNACTLMSMMSEKFMPSGCEVDISGVVGMYAMQLASGVPSALVDWNNNYGGDADKCVLFHCGNWAKTYLPNPKIATAPILETVIGKDTTHGALEGRTPEGPLTYCRVSTDDTHGCIRTYFGEGALTNDSLETFGCRAVAHIPQLQSLMRYICKEGFEHHVAINVSHTAHVLSEVFETYLKWETYYHQQPE